MQRSFRGPSLSALALLVALLTATLGLGSVAVAQTPAQPPLAPLVDDSFQVDHQVQLVSDAPVYEEPAVGSGLSAPDSANTLVWIIMAALGGMMVGTVLTCFTCWFMFATYYM